jgi:hypothetical protein
MEFFPNLVQRPLYPPMHGVPGSSQRKGIRTGSGTVFYVDREHPRANDNNKGWDAEYPLDTIQQAVDNAADNDWIVVMPGTYVETVTVDKSLTIIGRGGYDAVLIVPTTLAAAAMIIESSLVTLIGLSLWGEATADYGVAVDDGYTRFRAFDCVFRGGGNALQLTGNVNVLIEGCAFLDADNGIEIIDGATVTPDGIIVRNSFFSALDDAHIEGAATAATRLMISDCIFEGTTVPTKYLNIDGVGTTGIVTNCRIAHATNATAVIDIAAGVFWVANYTEAGVTTARPA